MTHLVEHAVREAGIGAPVAFVLLYAALTVALAPGTAPSVAAGAPRLDRVLCRPRASG